MDYRMTEKLDQCPYNPSHMILPHRMAKHIIKCKKNHMDANMKICIFNGVHVVPAHHYQAHLLECEDRVLVERELYCHSQEKKGPLMKGAPPPVMDPSFKCEDWESDCVQSSYSPGEHIIYKEFTRPPPAGLGKGARKQWRMEEIKRVNQLKNGTRSDDYVPGLPTAHVNRAQSAGGAIPKGTNYDQLWH